MEGKRYKGDKANQNTYPEQGKQEKSKTCKGKGKHWAYMSRRVPGEVHIANGINAVAFMYQGFKTLDAEKVAEKIKEKIK